MKNPQWKTGKLPEDMYQLRLFPLTTEQILEARLTDFADKLDRQRKSQFAKIGSLQKKYDDLLADVEIIKRGLCYQNNACEIVQMAVM